jgi:hypothetical protein
MIRLAAAAALVCAGFANECGAQTRPAATKPAAPPPTSRPAMPPSTQPASQPTATAKDLPTADDLVKNFIEAIGGKSAIAKVESVHVAVTIEGPMGNGTLDIKTGEKNKFLILQSANGMEGTVGSDGTIGWAMSPMGPQLIEGPLLEQTRKEMGRFTYQTIFHPDQVFQSMETVDRLDFQGQDCYKVRMLPKGKPEAEQFWYFSVDKKLVQGMDAPEDTPTGPIVINYRLDDWMPGDGVTVYHKIVLAQGGMEVPMTFSTVEFNKVDPAVFEPPAEVKELVNKKNEPPSSQPASTSAPATRPATTTPATRPSRPN